MISRLARKAEEVAALLGRKEARVAPGAAVVLVVAEAAKVVPVVAAKASVAEASH